MQDRKEYFVIMAEKYNAALDIAKAINLQERGEITKYKFIKGIAENRNIVITYTNGHVLELQEPGDIDEKYIKWNLANLPIPFNDNKLKIKKEKVGLYNAVISELRKASIIINAGDAGREGELIQRWVIEQAFYGRARPSVFRLWTQSLTSKAIKKAYNNILNDKDSLKELDNLYNAGRARAIMDKYIGYNYSRLISLALTDGITVSYGRCKTPLTNAIIQRDMEIENFKSKPFSYITINAHGKNDIKTTLVNEHQERMEFNSEDEAKVVEKNLGNRLRVTKLKIENKIMLPPNPFDILTLQKEMSKKYNYEADLTLEICESLYNTHHILSYPRTDSRYLTTDIKDELPGILKAMDFGVFSQVVKYALTRDVPDKYFNDKKVTDHHALIPTVPDVDFEGVYTELSYREKNVFNVVFKRFISLFMPNYEYESIEAILKDENDFSFLLKGKNDKELGFKKLFPKDKEDGDENEDSLQDLNLSEGEIFTVIGKEIINTKTKPKSRFTTASLLDFMKVNNIGTGATRDKLIKELTEVKGANKDSFVKKEGKFYTSTNFGRKIDALIPEDIKNIEHLKKLEQELADIENGKLSYENFIKNLKKEFSNKQNEIKVINKKFTFNNTINVKCPVCGKELKKHKWGLGCSGYCNNGNSCSFSIGNKYFDKKLSEDTLIKIIQTGKSRKMSFKTKSGDEVKGYLNLKIENGKAKLFKTYK